MKNKLYQNLETIGTILWLIMDFVWMCGFAEVAICLSVPVAFIMVLACIKYEGTTASELYSLNASVCWIGMNSLWIMNEITEKEQYLFAAKITFLISGIFIFLSLRASKKEKEPVDFKRLKIK